MPVREVPDGLEMVKPVELVAVIVVPVGIPEPVTAIPTVNNWLAFANVTVVLLFVLQLAEYESKKLQVVLLAVAVALAAFEFGYVNVTCGLIVMVAPVLLPIAFVFIVMVYGPEPETLDTFVPEGIPTPAMIMLAETPVMLATLVMVALPLVTLPVVANTEVMPDTVAPVGRFAL